jgi:tetratricopeptide (TPR) repeat protein
MGLAFTTALALDGEALLGALGADLQRAAAHADEAMAHSIEHSFPDYEQRARFIQGALLAQSGDPRRGIELMHRAIAAIERANSVNRRTLYLGHSAAAHASLGQPEVALDLLDEAIQTADKINERFFEAELHRLRGEILLTMGRRGEAEAGLRRALTIAQQQQARWWELRAATSLAKHWRDEGNPGGLFPPATGLWVVRRGFRHSIFERCQSTPRRAERPVRPASSSRQGVNYGSGSRR